MLLSLLKCKLHRACVTHAELDYEGSCAVDQDLMPEAGIRPFEQSHIYNVMNGERFVTYAIEAEAGSRMILINGVAAHRASPGARIIICTYVSMNECEAEQFHPALVYLDEPNRVVRRDLCIPAQAA